MIFTYNRLELNLNFHTSFFFYLPLVQLEGQIKVIFAPRVERGANECLYAPRLVEGHMNSYYLPLELNLEGLMKSEETTNL